MRRWDNTLAIDRDISEYIRGIAIVCVVLGHILGGTFGFINTHITAILGTGGVAIFLMLSGYGLYSSYRKNGLQGKNYWDKKIEKVFAPYAIVTVIYYLYMELRGTAPGAAALLSNVFCVDYARTIDATMWYMSFLLLWYVAFFLIFWFKGSLVGKIGLLVLLGFAFQEYWLKDTFQNCAWQFSVNAFAFPCGVAFGYVSELFDRSHLSEKGRAIVCLILRITSFAAGVTILALAIPQVVSIPYWVCGLATFTVLYALLSLLKRNVKVLKWLGAHSFLIYLIEAKVIAIWKPCPFLAEHPAVYLLSYTVAVVALVYLYRLGSRLFDRFRDFWELKPNSEKS